MSWETRQQCHDCWADENGERPPVVMAQEVREQTACVTCNHMTISGIYVRKEIK